METLSYETAFKELKQIEAEIINESVPIDVLSEKIKRASLLIRFCQVKLRAAEDEINKVIGEMDKE